MKLYIVDEHTIEEDYHHTLGFFTDLILAQSIVPSMGIELVLIKEMSLIDSEFLPTGYTYVKELEIDGQCEFWSAWVKTYIEYS